MSPESDRISSHMSSHFSNQNSSQKFSVVLPLRYGGSEAHRNIGTSFGSDLYMCHFFCAAPIFGYHNGEADFSQLDAVFDENPYTADWWGSFDKDGRSGGRRMDGDLDLLKDAAEVFEQQCASNV